MTNLSPHKRFPGPSGVDIPAEVTVSTPIPRRKVPLAGIKKMLFPPEPMHVQLGAELKSPWDRKWLLRMMIIWLLMIPAAVCLFLILLILILSMGAWFWNVVLGF